MAWALCDKCNRMHYTTDKCRVAQPVARAEEAIPLPVSKPGARDLAADLPKIAPSIPKPKRKDTRKGSRHKPGVVAKNMRAYRQRKKASQPHQTETER